jgi:hypothetical protein
MSNHDEQLNPQHIIEMKEIIQKNLSNDKLESPIENICRYCHENVNPTDKNIYHPCNCKSYLHKKCFTDYVNSKEKKVTKCEVCETPYIFKKNKAHQLKSKDEICNRTKFTSCKICIFLFVCLIFLLPYVIYIDYDVLYPNGLYVNDNNEYVPMKYCKCDPLTKKDNSVCFIVPKKIIFNNDTVNNQTIIPEYHKCIESTHDNLSFAAYSASLFVPQGGIIYVIGSVLFIIFCIVSYIINRYWPGDHQKINTNIFFGTIGILLCIQVIEGIIATPIEILLSLLVSQVIHIYYILIARQTLNAFVYACTTIVALMNNHINDIYALLISLILMIVFEFVVNGVGIFMTQIVFYNTNAFTDPDWQLPNIYNFGIGIIPLVIIISVLITIIFLIYKLIEYLFCDTIIDLENV